MDRFNRGEPFPFIMKRSTAGMDLFNRSEPFRAITPVQSDYINAAIGRPFGRIGAQQMQQILTQ